MEHVDISIVLMNPTVCCMAKTLELGLDCLSCANISFARGHVTAISGLVILHLVSNFMILEGGKGIDYGGIYICRFFGWMRFGEGRVSCSMMPMLLWTWFIICIVTSVQYVQVLGFVRHRKLEG